MGPYGALWGPMGPYGMSIASQVWSQQLPLGQVLVDGRINSRGQLALAPIIITNKKEILFLDVKPGRTNSLYFSILTKVFLV